MTLVPILKRYQGFCCLLLCFELLTLCAFSAAEQPEIFSKHEGDVFYEFEPVNIYIKVKRPASIFTRLRDYNGNTIRKTTFSELATNQLIDDVGRLQPGHYTYEVLQVTTSTLKSLGFAKLAVIRKARIASPESSAFGIDAFLSWRCQNLAEIKTASKLIAKAGISWVRDRFAWHHIEPEQGMLKWDKYFNSNRCQVAEGLKILQVFHDCPAWASSVTKGEHEEIIHHPPKDNFYTYNFFSQLAKHFKGTVNSWEIWNEMDVPVFFLGTAEDYTALLKAAYLGIKKSNPEASVLLGSTTLASGEITWGDKHHSDEEADRFIEKVFENGGGEYFDIYNMHYYGPLEGLVPHIKRNKNIMHKYKYDKPIWLTEIGFTATRQLSAEIHPLEKDQAKSLVKSYCLAFSQGIEKFFYFCFPSFIEHGVSYWGIFQKNGNRWRPKPAYVALANLVYLLTDKAYYGKIKNTPSFTQALLFTDIKQNAVAVVWSDAPTTTELTLSFSSPQILRLVDIMGQETELGSLSSLPLRLNNSPIFITGFLRNTLSNELDQPAKAAVEIHRPQYLKEVWVEIKLLKNTILGDEEQIAGELRVYNTLNSPVSGQLMLIKDWDAKDPALIKKLTIPAMGQKSVNFSLPISGKELSTTLPNEEYGLKAYLLDSQTKKSTLPATTYFKLSPLLKVTNVSLIDATRQKPELKIAVKAASNKPVTSKASISLPQGYQIEKEEVSFTIKPEKPEHILTFIINKLPTSWPQPNLARLRLQALEFQVEKDIPLEFNTIARATRPITIDGQVTDWHSIAPYFIGGRENFVRGTEAIDSKNELQGNFYLQWDEQNLYLFINVIDESRTNPYRHSAPWLGDAVELFLDLRPEPELHEPNYNDQVFQLFFVPPDDVYQDISFKVWQPKDRQFTGVNYAWRALFQGYSLEAAIPWQALTSTPVTKGRKIGFELTLDDLDFGDYQAKQLIWRGGADNWRNPALFSELILN